MLGGLYGLNFKQHSYLFMCLIIPSLITGLGLFYIDEALTTLCVLQFFYVVIPAIYIKFLSKEGELRAYLINELEGRQEQIKRGLSLFRSAFGMVLLSLIFTYYWEEEIMDYLKIPLLEHPAYIGAFMLVLIICNPFLEEWYWRLFLMKTYKESENYRSLIHLFYTLFHFIMLLKIFKSDWEFAIGFSTYFMSIGGSFEHIREKYGFITCLMAHYGMTLAASLALLVVYKSQLQ
ncbi:unnamed protein product (macronuclear) [Paramecium tetraurelia]|uniref:CAAX prenyl protease 2/Lysostaphin resistance protein A-like domain-containing protein n=1 Tax=Paramecium tetraurelia TaxID=5888 RepID=A0E438_PARTE|nr:uncharacterized protein GSPATT00023228001 [Paramecium tetraurelia]CAK90055.1 unnamed protein product [Paramecium tetraurelia]|eukprot:XP_001457452.1 hypothetical protein (macronuclear) [Paramecium tetraurelia strain d4-2]